jgi:hypothetical protein
MDDDDGNDRKNEDQEMQGGARQRCRPSTHPHLYELLLAGWTTVATDDNDGDTRKRKPSNDEGMTRDDQGGKARTSGATDPTTTGMV